MSDMAWNNEARSKDDSKGDNLSTIRGLDLEGKKLYILILDPAPKDGQILRPPYLLHSKYQCCCHCWARYADWAEASFPTRLRNNYSLPAIPPKRDLH
jgi:hypothetical protein